MSTYAKNGTQEKILLHPKTFKSLLTMFILDVKCGLYF